MDSYKITFYDTTAEIVEDFMWDMDMWDLINDMNMGAIDVVIIDTVPMNANDFELMRTHLVKYWGSDVEWDIYKY